MGNFMDGFMKGYAFMDKIEDNELRREREGYTFDRLKKADVRADNEQLAGDLENQIDLLYTDQDGNRLTDKQVIADPNKLKRVADLMNAPAFKELWMEGTGKEVKDIRVEEVVNNPDGTITPVFSHIGKNGEVISSGPATLNRTSEDTDIVAKATPMEGFNKLRSFVAKYSPTYAGKEVARRKLKGYEKDVRTVASEGQQGRTQPTFERGGSPSQTRETYEPIRETQQTQTSTQPKAAPEVGSITERAKRSVKKEPVSVSGVVRGATKKLEEAGAKFFERGVKNIVNTFETAADPDKEGSNVALDRITGFPKESGRKLVDNFSSIEKKLGPARAQEMRSAILDSIKEKGIDDPVLARDLERLEVLSPKLMKDVKKVETTMPESPTAQRKLLAEDKQLFATAKAGTKFSKQTGGPSKKYKDALIRLHMANPSAVPLDALERGLRTGRLAKRDLQFIANKNFIAVADKETGEVEVIKQFADPKAASDKAKADRLRKADRFKSMERITDLVYPDKKKQASQRSTFASRMLVSEDTLGFDITDPSVVPMIKTAESMTRGETSGWFADEPSDYPSHTPGIIAQGLGLKDLSEAKRVFFRPIEETNYYSGRPIPEGEAQKLSNIVAALQIKGVPIEEASALVVGALNKNMSSIFYQDPAALAEGYVKGRR